MSQGDTVSLLSESAARVQALARASLGLPELEVLSLRQPWRVVAARFLELGDGDYAIDDLIALAVRSFAVAAELDPDDAALAEASRPAWEAVARHLCQWVNEAAEGDLRGLEGSEAAWQEWVRQRTVKVLVGGA